MQKKHKFKPFKKKPKQSDLEDAEIDSLKARCEESIEPSAIRHFSDFPLSKKTLKGLTEHNYKTPTDIQRESIGLALQGRDILGAARTGSGKTLAFLVPILEQLYRQKWTKVDGVGAIIISPTRELAYQIFETLRKIGAYHDFSAGLVIGGKDLHFEWKRMDQCNIVICTPGRLLQHMDKNDRFSCTSMQILVLDEADRCLDLGFRETMNNILSNLPPERQTLLFSATQTQSVDDLARLSLNDYAVVAPHEQAEFSTPLSLQQNYVVMAQEEKIAMIWSFIKNHLKQKILVFMATCKQVKYVYEIFCKLRPGTSLLALYGTLHQDRRTAIYDEFMRKSNVVLFATDVASRGLDFPIVNWVVQLDCPEDATAYIHRAGRTARHKAKGENLLVLTPSEEGAMVDELRARKIPINKISIDPKRIFTPKAKMEAYLAQSTELKESAQRAFVAYFKSIALMKNKKVFNVESIDPDAFARSLGLVVTPRVRFLDRIRKKRKQEAALDSGEEEKEPPNSFNFHAESEESDDEHFLTVKRHDHEVKETLPDLEIDPEASQKKSKPLTKAALVKKITKKRIIPNRKVVFDEEGAAIVNTAKELQSELAKEYQRTDGDAEGGIDIDKARQLLQEEDKFDKERFKQIVKKKHKETKKKRKAKEEELEDDFGTDDEDAGPDLSWLPDPDRVFGQAEDAESDEETIHRPPERLVAKKVGKRKLDAVSEEKSGKKMKKKKILDDLSLQDAESLAMKLLGK